MRTQRPQRTPMLLAGVVVALALVALAIYLSREGADQSRVGAVTQVEGHRTCVQADDGEFCADADSPSAVADVDVDDCVALERSPAEIFESVRPSDGCR